MSRLPLLLSLALALTAPAAAQTALDGPPSNPAQLAAQWTNVDATCRTASAPAVEAVGACEQRDTLAKLLTLAEYCHVRQGKGGAAQWLPCSKDPSRARVSVRSTAPFQRVGGVFVLSALINGDTQTYFIADSGAATVQIPEETAEALRRNGTLTDADFAGQHRFVLADGRTMQQRVFRLRSLQIGERTMENVLATVGAPKSRALLGQSFLRRLNWWKVDNVTNVLEFEFTGAFQR